MAFQTLVAKKALGAVLRNSAAELGRAPALGICQSRKLQTFSLPDLPYDYGALEPAISGEIMRIHHQKHHQAYITNYNKALEQLDEAIAKGDSAKVVGLQGAIKFNGGGHVNHSIFWKNLAPTKGSGWVWLALDKELKKIKIETTTNQDPLVTKGLNLVPLLGIDVWEHAYYLQYKNVRPDYLKNIWNVINWKYASEVYQKESA